MISTNRVVLAIDDPELREIIAREMGKYFSSIVTLDKSLKLRWFDITLDDIIFLETSDDIAGLTQIVYELYIATGFKETINIIAIMSNKAASMNPSLMPWVIDRHAAVFAVMTRESLDIEHLAIVFQRAINSKNSSRGNDR